MEPLKPQRLNAQISEEAAEWFVEFRSGPMQLSSRAAFDAWIRASPEHLRAYMEIAAIWDESGDIKGVLSLDVDELIALSRLDANVVALKPSLQRSHARHKSLSAWSAAAIAAALIVTVAVAAMLLSRPWQTQVYQTAVGEQRSIVLADGSIIDLNARSRVRVRFSAAERQVELQEGQALFSVTKNPARPFIVEGGETRVRAVGTQFDVNLSRQGAVVTVVEGSVSVFKAANVTTAAGSSKGVSPPLLLAAGEQAVASTATIARAQRTNVSAAIAWRRHELIFDSVPLLDVAEAFNRYSTRKLIVEDSAVAPLRLSGAFDTNPEFLIRYLRERPDVEVSESRGEIRLTHHSVE
jgi:transmembrane sensor